MGTIDNISKRLKKMRLAEQKINYAELDHELLIKLAQQEDQQAFEELLKQYNNLIEKHSRKFFLDNGNGDAEDIKQVASLAFWEAVKSYNPGIHKNGFGAFAGMVIGRKLTDLIRKEDADVRKLNNLANSLEDTLAGDEDGGSQTVGDTVSSKDLSPEEQFLGREGARELMKFMRDKFSERERDVVMRHIKGDKISEIAEEMGMSYKSVENTLMRIKNKLNDYLRNSYRESKKMRRGNDIKFSDEEKKILESVITKVNAQESLKESTFQQLLAAYENYTEEQLDKELESIDIEIDNIIDELKDTDYNDRDDLMDQVEDLRYKLMAIEEYASEEQIETLEEIRDKVHRAEDTEYTGTRRKVDPYEERGLRRSDFM